MTWALFRNLSARFAKHDKLPPILEADSVVGVSNTTAEPIPSESNTTPTYAERVASENAIFAEQINVHDLPEIFHYWSNRYLRPKLETFGFSNPDQFFVAYLERAHADASTQPVRFISIGAGNCDTEVRIARALRDRGLGNFTLECIDINPAMLERGRAHAEELGVGDCVLPQLCDFNTWCPVHDYAAVMANQSLHHVVELEHLFDSVRQAMASGGRFIVADMIGRNGHQRWPEALTVVRKFWNELPPAYRYNMQLSRQEDEFLDWDCSGESFEGIRAQDILPLLLQKFGFEFFLGFANAIDPFIDRAFGHHFDAKADWDREFIDRVHACDEAEILAGRIKPTHMFAVMRAGSVNDPLCWQHLTPAFCARRPD